MKKSVKIIIGILVAVCFALSAVLLLWRYDVLGIFKDYKAVPVITLAGAEKIVTEGGKPYEDPGFKAEIGGVDATDRVTVEGSVDNTKTGDYVITYSLTNLKGRNPVSVKRVVTVVDSTPPVITLKGEKTVSLLVGSEYNDAGATAADMVDGDLSKNIKVESNVNTAEKGKYSVTYSVSDKSGNSAVAKREVVVKKLGNGNVIYLTFDDGPSKNTAKILDLLKKYNAHATFFVVGTNIIGNEALLKRMVDEGHTVAVHSYTHDYASVYKSPEAFWADNEKTRELIKKVTGKNPEIMRFIGGSSNTVSANYRKGIMSVLTKQTKAHGYEYFDWNISSGDAEGDGIASKKLYANVISGIRQKYETPIVLMHDSGTKATTVKAVALVLKQATAQGYSFDALDDTVPAVHHGVNN